MRSVITSFILLVTISCSKRGAEEGKVLNLTTGAEVKGMDPIYTNDGPSVDEVARVYEGLLQYHYLKRPYELIPNLADGMPLISKDGRVYKFKIKKGVYFHHDKIFPEGKGRELKASDFVYSIKRLADPKLQSRGFWTIDKKIVGLNEWMERNSSKDKVNYEEEVEGLKATGPYELQFKLTKPSAQFLYVLAMPFSFVVAREIVEAHGDNFINHPVGTGPFVLKRFSQSSKIVYEKNPNFREKYFPGEEGNAEKRLPLIDKIVVHIIKESQPRWLNFQKGKIDYISIPRDNFESAITPDHRLTEELKKKEIELLITPALDVTYVAFNHDLKLFSNVDLRRAMMLAYDVNKGNKLFYNNTALQAQSIIPPGVAGYDENFQGPYRKFDMDKAKVLLKKAGYPGGKGLPEITYDCFNSTIARQQGEFFKKQMKEIGIDIKVRTGPWPVFLDKINKRKIMTFSISWMADYPDAENFLQLLYGPNRSPGANGSGYNNTWFNGIFEQARAMTDPVGRSKLYRKMNEFAADQVPWVFGFHRQNFVVKQSWLKNYIPSDFDAGDAQYLDIDIKKKMEMLEKL